jgi:molybdopterin-guanine dinucleotide biosynthesis protein A
VILAGGKSRRMGREKLSLEVGGLTMIEHVSNVLSASCQEVLVVGCETICLEGVRLVSNERAGRQGPLAGIEAGLAASNYDHVFVAAGDMPFLSQRLVGYLLERLGRGGVVAVIPHHGGRSHPLCGAYARTLLPRVSAALDGGARAVGPFLEGTGGVDYVGEELRRCGEPDLLLMNVNSPRDLDRARREAGR